MSKLVFIWYISAYRPTYSIISVNMNIAIKPVSKAYGAEGVREECKAFYRTGWQRGVYGLQQLIHRNGLLAEGHCSASLHLYCWARDTQLLVHVEGNHTVSCYSNSVLGQLKNIKQKTFNILLPKLLMQALAYIMYRHLSSVPGLNNLKIPDYTERISIT